MVWWLWTNPFVPVNPFFAPSGTSDEPAPEVEQHISALAEHGAQACCSWSANDGFYHFSQNWLRITGVAADDCMENRFIDHLHPESVAEFNDGIQAIFHADPAEKLDSYHMEARIMRGDGYWGWADVTIIPMRCNTQKVASLLLSDVTEQKRLEHTVELTQRQSDIANMGRSSFLSNMSHELRTPLNAIMGFAQLLRNRSSLSDLQAQDYLELIQESGQELLVKINDLIELANIDGDCAKLYDEPINMTDVIDAAIEMHSHQAFKKNIAIKKELSAPQVVLQGDRTKLIHVVSNLLINAIKHSQEHGSVIIGCEASNQHGITITIKDHGSGIEHTHLSAIKDALNSRNSYYCTDISNLRLGLAISKEFTELHGGKLCIESIPKKGTLASVHLPTTRIVSLSARVKPKAFAIS